MKVKCRANTGKSLSKRYLSHANNVNTKFGLEIGQTYYVYGIKMNLDVLYYFIIDEEASLPFWYPAELFEVSDNLLPIEWYYNYYGDDESINVTAIWGYKELVFDLKHHDDILERTKEAIKVFLERKKELDEYESFKV